MDLSLLKRMSIIDSIRFRLSRRYRVVREGTARALATVNQTPIFVLGNQKSGTTAIAVLLAERAGLSVAYDLTEGHSTLVADIYQGMATLDALVDQNQLEFSREVIKDPNLTFLYKLLRDRFPDAQFATVVRDPRANIRSICDRLNLPGDKSTLDPDRYDEMNADWGLVVDGSWMGIEGENYIDHLAARWRRAARIYLGNKDHIELIRYEDFVDGKIEAIDNLLNRLGGEKRNGIEDKVDRQFQPRGHRRGVEWESFFGPSNLRRIENRCADQMAALGYDDYRTQ